jgi:hypothetical protein
MMKRFWVVKTAVEKTNMFSCMDTGRGDLSDLVELADKLLVA